MSTDYTTVCDFCGAKVCGKSDDWTVKSNNWRISVDNSWFEPRKDDEHFELKHNTQVDKDACLECAKKVSDVIKKILPNQ